MIISASRRTDIPSYYSDWFINRLKDGYVYVRNPVNYRQVSNVPLSPDLVDCIVFWTKDVRPMINKLVIIEKMGFDRYYFQYTITPYGRTIESNIDSKKNIISSVLSLRDKIGRERIVWRYDPIIINKRFDIAFHVKSFEGFCRRLHKSCDHVIVSFIDIYSHIKKIYEHPREEDVFYLSTQIKEICASYGLPVQSCCENGLVKHGIPHGSCIDKQLIAKICGRELKLKKDNNQRKNCLCCESIDVGTYNTCLNGCTYCYANKGKSLSMYYDEYSPLLCSTLSDEDNLYDRNVVSCLNKYNQLSLF